MRPTSDRWIKRAESKGLETNQICVIVELNLANQSLWSLFQTIQCPVKLANLVWQMSISWRWLHINFFTNITIEKDIFHIHLKKIPTTRKSNNKEGLDRSKASHRRKCLLIINAKLLIEPFSHKMCLVLLNRPIKFCHNLVYPLAPSCSFV
jgi:hypothetical protein